MTVFKTFWSVVKKYRGTVILYTVMLVIFGGLNFQTADNNIGFTNTLPDLYLLNEDGDTPLANNLVAYLKKNSKIKEIDASMLDDAIFYRDVNYAITIPKNYNHNVLNGKNPEIKIKSTGDYNASLMEMTLNRYLKTQNIYVSNNFSDDLELIELINSSLESNSTVEIMRKTDQTVTNKMASYFNFSSYSIMAVIIFIVCLVMSSFNNKLIKKRINVSSMDYKKHNHIILLSSMLYGLIVFILFIILGTILIGTDLLSLRGLIYMLNALVFTFCSLTIAILISNLINNKDAVSGIVNVLALGSAFLCGAFVPAAWLPDSVLKIAHILPSYWFINSNDLLKEIDIINFVNLKPVFTNIFVILVFSCLFIIINNIVSKIKQKA